MILHSYFARKFFLRLLGIIMGFLVFGVLTQSIELMRGFSGEDMPFSRALNLSLLQSPSAVYHLLPVIASLASLSLYLNLSRTSELVVTRAVGRSALRSLTAPTLSAIVAGIIGVAAFNPILAATSKLYDKTISQIRTGSVSSFSLTREGLWLRQGSPNGQTVIFAERANADGSRLFAATFFEFSPDGRALRRIQTKYARLNPGLWTLGPGKSWDIEEDAKVPEKTAVMFESMTLETNLTSGQILDSFGSPSNVSIWDVQAFISRLENSGFSALRYRVYFQMELALPLLLAGMVMIAAGFSMRPARFGNRGLMILMAIMTAFSIFLLRNFAQILGVNSEIPVMLAAWGPPVTALCLGLALVLHLEDG